MTIATTIVGPRRPSLAARGQTVMLLVGFAAAVALRLVLGGLGPARSVPAGLVFAGLLGLLAWAAGGAGPMSWRAAGLGGLGAAVLGLPPLLARVSGAAAHRPGGSYVVWALVVAAVAAAEELFLRGALFGAVRAWRGPAAAVAVGAVAFAALHVPLYGWHVFWGDLAVGVWLGALRVASGSWVAPGVAHIGADLAGWWLR